ncbi:MAG: TetR/AcrR family transcriptional regulator [Ferrovibrionaceae bacterium]
MPRDATVTRQRILTAAEDLFYGEGIRATGVDRIAARAGVTKRTLYQHFASKDDLITAYVEGTERPALGRYQALVADVAAAPDRIGRIFANLGRVAADPRWKGCSFARVAAELAGSPGHPALQAASRHKQAFEAWIAEMLAETVHRPAEIARQVMILLDGAITEILIHRDAGYAAVAGRAAATLIAGDSVGRPSSTSRFGGAEASVSCP